MNSRMDKYRDENEETAKRTTRNKNIYSEVGDDDFANVNLGNNVSVIDTPLEDLDIDKIKKLLEEKYKENSRKATNVEDIYEEETPDLEDTKEYDLKKILETAHKNKKTDYDHERFTKLRETQYDILKSLNVDKREPKEEEEKPLSSEEATLMNLIKTVNYNAEKNKQHQENTETEDDLLSDLIGEGTQVLAPVFEDDIEPDKKPTIVEELEKTKQLSKKDIEEELIKAEERQQEKEDKPEENKLSKTEELANSFYTGKLEISDKDMDDFEDLTDSINGGSVIIKILIVLIVLIVCAVAVYLLNKYLNLGLF